MPLYQKIHKILLGFVMIASVGLIHAGYFFEGSGVLAAEGAMIIIWGIFGFCPIEFALKKIFKS